MNVVLKKLDAQVVSPVLHAVAFVPLLTWYALQFAYCAGIRLLTEKCPHGETWSNTLLFVRWDNQEKSRRSKKCRLCGGLHTRSL